MNKNRKKKGSVQAVILAAMMTMSLLAGCQSGTGDSGAENLDASTSSASSSATGEQETSEQEDSAASDQPAQTSSDGSVDTSLVLSESTMNTEFTDNEKNAATADAATASITLNKASASVTGDGVTADGSAVTITKEGTYVVSGTLSDGQIIVEAADSDKVWIVLDNANINCETSAAIYVKQADKVFLSLADGSENTLSGGTEYVTDEENTVDGVIFSADDLCINGSGALNIEAKYKHGIVSKDDLVVTGGELNIDAVSQCLAANDELRILDGTFAFTSQGKGMKAENDEDTTLGNIYIAGGTFTIDVEDDAVHAGGSAQIDGGTFTIDAGDDGIHAELDTVINGGIITINSCYEGLEGERVTINDGTIELYASDDGINAASSSASGESTDVPGGVPSDEDMQQMKEKMASGEMPADAEMPADGELPPDGEVPADAEVSADDAAAASSTDADAGGKAARGGFGNRGGQLPEGAGYGGGDSGMGNDANAFIQINGGTVTVNALGDGIDSNGALLVTGGTTYVNGPTDSGNGSLDYGGSAVVTGGTLIAAGSSAMATTFTSDSTQYSFMEALDSTQAEDTKITLKDSDGNVILTYTPIVSYNCVIMTCPDLKEGETYTLTCGEESTEITLDSVSVSNVTGGMGQKMMR